MVWDGVSVFSVEVDRLEVDLPHGTDVPGGNLKPLHLTSCTKQRSTFLLVLVSTISLDLPHGTDVPGGNLKCIVWGFA